MKACTILSPILVSVLIASCSSDSGTGTDDNSVSPTGTPSGSSTTGNGQQPGPNPPGPQPVSSPGPNVTNPPPQGTSTVPMPIMPTPQGTGGTPVVGPTPEPQVPAGGGVPNNEGGGPAVPVGTGGSQNPQGGSPATGGGGAGPVNNGGGPVMNTGGGGAGPVNNGGGGAGPVNTGGAPTEEPPDELAPFDCGANAFTIEAAGPAANRVNYVIIGDGYTEAELETTYLEHIQVYMEKRFSDPIGQPYLRYRKFVNICAAKLASTGAICGGSALDCCGDDNSRLANCNQGAANDAMADAMSSVPDFDIDWTAVVLNGDSWWNTGATLMLWSGGNNDADGAALHEGGHGFHRLTDEYGACGTNLVNGAANEADAQDRWGMWMGYDQQPGTGEQGLFNCDGSNLRPTQNSMMNSLFGDNANTSFNSISREKMVFDFWRYVEPIDSVDPPAGTVSGTTVLRVNVIDPEVINVNWSVDGTLVEEDGGAEFDVSTMGAGTYQVTALAFDNAGEDLVRSRDGGDWGRDSWERSQQEVSWTVTVP